MIFPDEDEAWCQKNIKASCLNVIECFNVHSSYVVDFMVTESKCPQSVQDAVNHHDLYLKSETYEELKRFIKLVALKAFL